MPSPALIHYLTRAGIAHGLVDACDGTDAASVVFRSIGLARSGEATTACAMLESIRGRRDSDFPAILALSILNSCYREIPGADDAAALFKALLPSSMAAASSRALVLGAQFAWYAGDTLVNQHVAIFE